MTRQTAQDELLREAGGLLPHAPRLAEIMQTQLHIARYEGESSLPLFPLYESPRGEAADGTVGLCVMAGRQLEAGIMTLDAEGRSYAQSEVFDVDAKAPVTMEELLYAAVQLLAPLWPRCDRLVVCLPFALRYEADGEAFVTRAPYGLRLESWENLPLCATFARIVSEEGLCDKSCRVIDAAAATLREASRAGEGRSIALYWDECQLAAAFAMPEEAIPFAALKRRQHTIVVCDTARFSGTAFAPIDYIADRDSEHPGELLYLKQISDIGEKYRASVLKLAEVGMLSFACRRDFLSLTKLTDAQFWAFVREPKGAHLIGDFCRHEEADEAICRQLAELVIRRIVHLLAEHMEALLLQTGAAVQNKTVCIALAGACFTPELASALHQTLAARHSEGTAFAITLRREAEAVVYGAAYAAQTAP